jgi:hypothetical protein
MPKVTKDQMPHLQKDYTVRRFGEKLREIEVKNKLEAIKVEIYGAPSIEEFRKTLSIFLMNTWEDDIKTSFAEEDIDVMIKELFRFELLPTAMETIGLTWYVNNIDMIDTTHVIRHRNFSISSSVHGDRDMRHDWILLNPGILANEEYKQRFIKICDEARHLYAEMMDSGLVHGLDARTIMPRAFPWFLNVRCNIKDAIGYINMRRDEQIQTVVDNIIALRLWLEIVKRYPFLRGLVDFSKQDDFYVRQCKAGKRNIFAPNQKNDKFEWCEEQFYHGDKGRDDFPGSNIYLELKASILQQIKEAESRENNDPMVK